MEIFLVILALTLYWLIDSSVPRQFGYGVVIDKKFRRYRYRVRTQGQGCPNFSAWSQEDWSQEDWSQEDWSQKGWHYQFKLCIRMAHATESKLVSQKTYQKIKEGDRVSVVYFRGRVSKKIYIKKVGDSSMDFDFMENIPESFWF